MNRLRQGFTLVEMMVIAPIVILLIGSFVALIVNLTGEVLSSRGSNSLAYEIQDALNRIEDDVKLSTGYLAVNNISLTSTKQGYGTDKTNGSTVNFTNIQKPGGSNASLIVNGLVTNGNPMSTTAGLIYLANRPNNCSTLSEYSKNTPMTMNVVYFVDDDNVLWRRVLMRTDYDNAGLRCGSAAPWQQPSCMVGYNKSSMSFCKTNDVRLLDGVSPTDFTIEYFASADSTSSDTVANNNSITDDSIRNTALQSTPTVKVSITSRKNIAGRDITGTGSIRVTRLDTNASTIAEETAPTTAPSSPNVSAKVSEGHHVTFSWPRVSGATSYALDFRINGGSWQNNASTRGMSSNTRSYTVESGNHTDTVEARVRATNSFGDSDYGNSSIAIPLWAPLLLNSSWSDYEQGYGTAAYTKTSAGLVMLKGLIKKSSAVTSGEIIAAALPVDYRPAGGALIFGGMTNANTWGRIDVSTAGHISAATASEGWLSLESIRFMASSESYPRSTPSFLNGWTNYNAGYAPASYVQDSTGRVALQGLVANGNMNDNTPMFNLPANLATSYLHMATHAATTGQSLFGVVNNVQAKGRGTNNYISINGTYLPSSASVTWSNIPFQSGWVNYNTASFPAGQYTKTSDGVVHLRGLLKSGTTGGGSVVGTLPSGFRPKQRLLLYSVNNGEQARIDVLPDGRIVATTAYNGWLSLDAISFMPEQ